MGSATASRDGSTDFSGGINSIAVTTLADARTPNGLKRSELAWLANGTVRDNGITQRSGWIKIATIASTGLFQGKFVYEPIDGSDPYEIWGVSGHILKVDLDTGAVVDLSAVFGLTHPATERQFFFCQGDRFLVIQAGDNSTLPLFWDGVLLRRSNGITGVVGPPGDVTHQFTVTAPVTIPAVGAVSGNITLTAAYAGAINDIGVYAPQNGSPVLGTFEVVTSVGAVITLRTIASDFVGSLFPATSTLFTVAAAGPAPAINEIPAATEMFYYQGRIWYALGRVASAGDIVNGPSGTQAYNFRDSVLKVTENPLAIGGDGFEVPSQDGSITAIRAGGNIDSSVGLGRLFIFTRKAVYALDVPISRNDWIAANANNQPLMTVVQLSNGTVSGRSVVPVNGDLYYQSLEPAIRSLDQSIRYFNQPGNRNLSANEQRIIQFNDRSLLWAATGIYFNNRLLQSALPRQTDNGVVHDAVIPLDFIPISTFGADRTPNWEGHLEGTPIFQMAVADFGGLERAFAAVLGTDGSLQLWEITVADRFDFSRDSELANRVDWYLETPAFTWGDTIGMLELKKLVGAELWIDRLFGTVIFAVDYRPNSMTCWIPWIEWDECSAKNTAETVTTPVDYPVDLGECYRSTLILPKPPTPCQPCNNNFPAYIGLQFQARIRIKGFCRLRGFWMWAEPVERGMYQPTLVC